MIMMWREKKGNGCISVERNEGESLRVGSNGSDMKE